MKNQFLYEPSEPKPKRQKKQKKNKFLLGMISLAIIVPASCSSWGFPDPDGLSIPNWGKSTTVAGGDKSMFNGTAMDNDGNIVAVGWIEGYGAGAGNTFQFGYGDGVMAIAEDTSGSKAVIVKYKADTGKTLWARSVNPAPEKSEFNAVATDRFGNIYAVGYQYGGSFDYGNGVTVSGAYGGGTIPNAVLVKYNSDGQALWARSTKTALNISRFTGVAVDKDGNIYTVGFQMQNGIFDYGNGVTVSGAYSGGSNAVIVKYNSDGQALWAKSVNPAPNSSQFSGVATDRYGNIYAVGSQYGNSSFDYGNGVTVSGSYTEWNSVILKYNSGGQAQWAKSTVAAQNSSFFNSVATTLAGDIYAVGNQERKQVFNYGNGVTATGKGDSNSVIVGYDVLGTAKWAKTMVVVNSPSSTNSFKSIVAGNYKLFVVGYQFGSPYNYDNGAGNIKGAGSLQNPVITTFEH